MKGLSRGAIATRKLKGVKRDKGHEDYTGSAPYGEGKSLRPVEMVLLRVSMTRELNRSVWFSICCLSSLNHHWVIPLNREVDAPAALRVPAGS